MLLCLSNQFNAMIRVIFVQYYNLNIRKILVDFRQGIAMYNFQNIYCIQTKVKMLKYQNDHILIYVTQLGKLVAVQRREKTAYFLKVCCLGSNKLENIRLPAVGLRWGCWDYCLDALSSIFCFWKSKIQWKMLKSVAHT